MKFSKLQATGNDFILVDARKSPLHHSERGEESPWANLAQTMCPRHFGIGADGLILVQNSKVAGLKMRIFNPDGSEAEVCGNGLRCFAKYVIEREIALKANLAIETLSGIRKIKAYTSGDKVNQVEVNMGIPQFQPEQIPIEAGTASVPSVIASEAKQSPLIICQLSADSYPLSVSLLSMGNPHAVSFLSEPVADFPLTEIGPKVERHPMFPQRTNFEIARVLSRGKIEARVWERGVGETLACGSGACAIAVAAQLLNYVDQQVDIILPGGTLTTYWDTVGEVLLTGPVEEIFAGEWLI
jgi:diaminopimelate epimerase